MSAKEISTRLLAYGPLDPVRAEKSIHDSDGESSMKYDLEAHRIFEENRTKRRIDLDAGSGSCFAMENQL